MEQPQLSINLQQKHRYEQEGFWTEAVFLDRWRHTVQAFGTREFLIDDIGNRYTYTKMDELSDHLATAFLHIGLKSGDIAAIQCPIWSEFILLVLACYKVGAVPSPLSMHFGLPELKLIFPRTKPAVFICPVQYKNQEFITLAEHFCSEFPGLQTVFLDRDGIAPSGAITLQHLMQIPAGSFKPCSTVRGNDLALVICTSGTTGAHKCAMHTHNTMLFTEDSYRAEYRITERDVLFMPSPLCHAIGFMHGIILPILAGAKLVIQEKFAPKKALELICEEGCTFSHGATPFAYDLITYMEATGKRAPSMRFYACGGAEVPGSLIRRGAAVGLKVCECYGSTESPRHVGIRPEDWSADMMPSAGHPMPATEIKLVDAAGNEVPPGQSGEECCRGPQVFVGYMGDPAATKLVLDKDGWYHGGDLCKLDGGGNLRVICRIKDIIIRGGLNLDANYLNGFVLKCPSVRASTVIGMPDERLGERICAYVVPKNPTQPITREALLSFMEKQGVPKYCWPERVENIDAVPMTESGKVNKLFLQMDLKQRMKFM